MVAQWFYKRTGTTVHGPFMTRKLKQLASSGELRPNDRLRMDGSTKVVRAGTMEGLFPATIAPETL